MRRSVREAYGRAVHSRVDILPCGVTRTVRYNSAFTLIEGLQETLERRTVIQETVIFSKRGKMEIQTF